MSLRLFSLVVLMAAGCGSTADPPPSAAKPYITPEERAKMPPHERDDPYTLQHMQKPEAARRQ